MNNTGSNNKSSRTLAKTRLWPSQLASLRGLVSGLMPPMAASREELDRARDPTELRLIREFWEYDLSSDPDYLEAVETALFDKLNRWDSLGMRCLLVVLAIPLLGGLVVFWTIVRWKPFGEWSTEEQTAAMQLLRRSRFQNRRWVFNGLKRLVTSLAFSYVNHDTMANPFWKAMGYPGPPSLWSSSSSSSSSLSSGGDEFDRNGNKEKENEEESEGGKAKGKIDYRTMDGVFLDMDGRNDDRKRDPDGDATVLEYDIVVVGSGSGGGVAASVMAKAGFSVLVLEKGSYLSPSDVTNYEADAIDRMYEAHGLLTSTDGNIMVLAGSTLGGGTAINWSCCIPLPEHVRKEWAQVHGLAQFGEGSAPFEASQATTMKRIDCDDKTNVTQSISNRKLMEGCRMMGYAWEANRQNIRLTHDDRAGFICFGDKYGNKSDGLSTFLLDAVKDGARMMENFAVERVLLERTADGQQKRAVGVMGRTSRGRSVTIHGRKAVILSAGALQTPCLLLRSGLKNPHIGRHLHLHPTAAVAGSFHDDDIHCYLKAPMTGISNEFQHGPRNDGYGCKIYCPSAHPGLIAAGFPYTTAEEFKSFMRRMRHGVPLILTTRDTTEGTVSPGGRDGMGPPRLDYVLNEPDRETLLHSVKGALRILIAAGADDVGYSHMYDPMLRRISDDLGTGTRCREDIDKCPRIQEYLDGLVERGSKEHELLMFCAHQMGSCRMSTAPEGGVVDENGRVWGCHNLYLMDTSIFPTASGANPMLTTLATSHMLSTRLCQELLAKDASLG